MKRLPGHSPPAANAAERSPIVSGLQATRWESMMNSPTSRRTVLETMAVSASAVMSTAASPAIAVAAPAMPFTLPGADVCVERGREVLRLERLWLAADMLEDELRDRMRKDASDEARARHAAAKEDAERLHEAYDVALEDFVRTPALSGEGLMLKLGPVAEYNNYPMGTYLDKNDVLLFSVIADAEALVGEAMHRSRSGPEYEAEMAGLIEHAAKLCRLHGEFRRDQQEACFFYHGSDFRICLSLPDDAVGPDCSTWQHIAIETDDRPRLDVMNDGGNLQVDFFRRGAWEEKLRALPA